MVRITLFVEELGRGRINIQKQIWCLLYHFKLECQYNMWWEVNVFDVIRAKKQGVK